MTLFTPAESGSRRRGIGNVGGERAVISRAVQDVWDQFVRANAVSGTQCDGTSVRVAGRELGIGEFFVHGPYLSFNGMLTIAALFRIAPPPPRLAVTLATERARRSAGSIPRSAADIAEDLVNGDDCLLTAEELRVCFVLSSHCAPQHATFALDSPENTQEKELASVKEKIAPEQLEEGLILKEMASPSAGLTFTQFLDCLGRIAVVAMRQDEEFRSNRRACIYQGLLIEHMGLDEKDVWGPKCGIEPKKADEAEAGSKPE